jgi:hypothetical protein
MTTPKHLTPEDAKRLWAEHESAVAEMMAIETASSPSELDALPLETLQKAASEAHAILKAQGFVVLASQIVGGTQQVIAALRSSVLEREFHVANGQRAMQEHIDAERELSRLREELRQANEDKQALIEGKVFDFDRSRNDDTRVWWIDGDDSRHFATADEALAAYRSLLDRSSTPTP